MGRICRICGRSRPNERFGGRGMRAVVCADCRKLPKEERRRMVDSEHSFVVEVARLPIVTWDAGEFWRIPLHKSTMALP
jgi:hypothetical protein